MLTFSSTHVCNNVGNVPSLIKYVYTIGYHFIRWPWDDVAGVSTSLHTIIIINIVALSIQVFLKCH